jgi:hypothetical protein
VSVALERKEFYPRLSARVWATIVVLLLLISGVACVAVRMSIVRTAALGVVTGVAIAGLTVLWSTLARPLVILDDASLRIGRVKLHWNDVWDVYPCRYRGAPLVAVRTLDDDDALRRLPGLMAASMNVRRRSIGALFAIPQLRGIERDELVELLRSHQRRAVERKRIGIRESGTG